MAGQKQIGWGKLVATALFTAVFVLGGLISYAPKVYAADYNWVDATHINDFTCSDKGDGNLDCFQPITTDDICPNLIRIEGSSDKGKLISRSAPNANDPTSIGACDESAPQDITIGATQNAPGGLLTTAQGNTQNGTDPSLECHVSPNPLTWILCPVVKGINAILQQLDDAIVSMLTVDQKKIFDTTAGASGAAYHEAWQSFRNIALALLLVAGIIMVIAQALGFEILDAYTIKKILPRLLIAIIGISLSWELMKFFVGLTNDLGTGIRWIIYSPFKSFNQQLELGGSAQLLLNIAGAGAVAALGIMGLLSFVGTALMAIALAFLVLILRQLVIILLVMSAPIAIACSILPNTQGVYKIWYESFTKALMMFPIVVGMIAVGKVFAVTAVGTDITGAKPISQLVGFFGLILSYFSVLFAAKFAGGALRFIGGAVNDRNRGAFDRLKKYRGNKLATRAHAMKEGNLYRPNNALARGFNATTSSIALAPKAGLNPFAMRSRFTSAKAQQEFDAAEEIRTKNADFALGAQDDRTLKAAQYGRGRADIRRILKAEGMSDAELDTGVGIVERMQATGSPQAVAAAASIQRFATGTGYNKKVMGKDGIERDEFDYQAAMDSIKQAGGGDMALQGRLLGLAKGEAARAGQVGFGGASYGTLMAGLKQANSGQGKVDGDAIALNAFESNDAVSISRARNPHVAAMTRAATDRIQAIQAGTAMPRKNGESLQAELGRLTAQIENFQETAAMYAAPERQTIINTEVRPVERISGELRTQATVHYADPAARARDPISQQPLVAPPENIDEYRRTRNSRRADPNDPFNQDKAA